MNKSSSLVRILTVILTLVSIGYLSYTLVGSMMTKNQKTFVASKISKLNIPGLTVDSTKVLESLYGTEFRDSLNEHPMFGFYTHKSTKRNEIKLGLDLQGGMSFVLEVQIEDILRSLSYNSKNATFNSALAKATEMQKNSQADYLTLLGEAYTQIDPTAKLATVFAPLQNYQEKLNINDDNSKVISVLRNDVNAAVKNSFNVIKNRINQSGLVEPTVSLQEGTGRIIVELPGADDAERVKKLLEQTAKLEFWHTFKNAEVIESLVTANDIIKSMKSLEKKGDSTKTDILASASLVDSTKKDSSVLGGNILGAKNTKADSAKKDNSNPLFEIFQLNISQQGMPQEGPMVGFAQAKDIPTVNSYLNDERVKNTFRKDLKFLWGAKAFDEKGKFFPLYAIKTSINGEAPLTGESVMKSDKESDQYGQPSVGMTMNGQGAAVWEKMTEKAYTDKTNIAVVLDNLVYSAPSCTNGKISGGRTQISGSFSVEEAIDLANILNSGKLEAPAKIIQEEVVGPTLGAQTVKAGVISLVIGLLVIFLFMFLNYHISGLVADLALVFNLLFILGILSSQHATLTLPGIAGIVLIIGAAVDANVIIYERIKEELRNGKSYWAAVADGYKHSYSAIIDANVTTLITSLTLMFFGYGPVKGFAITLTIGIFTSLFTAVLLTKEIFAYNESKGREINFGKGLIDKLFLNSNFAFIGKRRIAYIVSMISIIVGTASMLTRGFELGVDFKGGRSYVVSFDKDVNAPELTESLNGTLDKNTVVKTYGASNQVQITTSYLYDKANAQSKESDNIVLNKVYEGAKKFYGKPLTFEEFRNTHVKNTVKIDATIADDIRNSALWVSIVALVGIFLYVAIRFPRWQFAAGAIAALIHDLFFVLGILSLCKGLLPFSLEMNQTIIAAVLTLIGYSTNDTVVIFDRIREYLGMNPNGNLEETVNTAVNKTLSRTIMTSTTLLLVILVLFIFGGESIRSFSFTMLIGILVGTYSSIFVASPVAVDLINMMEKKKK